MAVRSSVGKALESSVGKERTDAVRARERRIRAALAAWLEPRSAAPKAAPKPTKPPTAATPTPAPAPTPPPAPVEKPSRLKTPGELASRPAAGWEDPDPEVEIVEPECDRYQFLAHVHELTTPRTYLEVGVFTGVSLALSRTRSIGVDPDFRIIAELQCDVQLVRDGSDEFFAREDAVAHFEGVPVDFAFIDGMHLSEFALRDFMNVERLMSPAGVIVLDDVMPQNIKQAARDRRTIGWTGDVYKLVDILREQRPDLTIVPVNTSATGTALVLGLDPTSTVLAENYERNLELCQTDDPQDVGDRVLRRLDAVAVSQVLDWPGWSRLVELRESGDTAAVRALIAEVPLPRPAD